MRLTVASAVSTFASFLACQGVALAASAKRQLTDDIPVSPDGGATGTVNETIVVPVLVIVFGVGVPCFIICLWRICGRGRNALKTRIDKLPDLEASYYYSPNPYYGEYEPYPYGPYYNYYDYYDYYPYEYEYEEEGAESKPVPAKPAAKSAADSSKIAVAAAKPAADAPKKSEAKKVEAEDASEESYEYEEVEEEVEEELEEEYETEEEEEEEELAVKILLPEKDLYQTLKVTPSTKFSSVKTMFADKKKPSKPIGEYKLYWTNEKGAEVALDDNKTPADLKFGAMTSLVLDLPANRSKTAASSGKTKKGK